ncbi:DinB family protein [Sneathiella glossodoripedis]|uniref:DinB family protein n=1 Tax=Sneathiella glossodoripedis TaxID=418853 RepID=UPI00046F46C1|nr:DinB family protein [Sneathiella glossodoripedis]
MKSHFINFANYNRWANQTLYSSVAELTETELNQDVHGFFTSIFNTLNHILVGDLLWMNRLDEKGPKPARLDTILASNFDELVKMRTEADERLISIANAQNEEILSSFLDYVTTGGIACHDRVSEIMTHIFNHQTHHRGQCHHMLSQLGKEPPSLDMIYFIRERDNPR